MNFSVNKIAIVGAGLLGASIGLGLKQRRLVGEVIGIGRRAESLAKAKTRGAIDQGSTDINAAANADLIIVATPAALVIPTLNQLRTVCSPGATITDVASTKAAICAHADAIWTAPRRFVGSHPMAGSEKHGPEHATADFYVGSICLMEPATDSISAHAHDLVRDLWEALGAQVAYIAPEHHDNILARTSHLPHVAASGLAMNVLHSEGIGRLVGNGFRDTTRIAASRPEIWRDICLTNRDALLEALLDYTELLSEFAELLELGDASAIEAFFEEGARARHLVLGE